MRLNPDPWIWLALLVFLAGWCVCISAIAGVFVEPWKLGEQIAQFMVGAFMTLVASKVRDHQAAKRKAATNPAP